MQHGGDDFDGELCQRQVGCREPDEGQTGDKPGAAGKDQRRETVILGLPGRSERADAADQPEQHERRSGRRRRPRAPGHAVRQHGQQGAAESDADEHQQLRLQAPRAEQPLDASRRTASSRPTSSQSNMRCPSMDVEQRRPFRRRAPERNTR